MPGATLKMFKGIHILYFSGHFRRYCLPKELRQREGHAHFRLLCYKPENHVQSMTPKCLYTRARRVGMT